MKKLLLFMMVLSSVCAFAGNVRTKLQGKIRLKTIDGKLKKLAPVRVFITHNSNPSGLDKDCKIEIGRKDALSLWTETDSWTCIATKKAILVDQETIEDIFYRSAIFSFKDRFDQIGTIFDEGVLINETLGSSQAGNILGNFFYDLSEMQQISLGSKTVMNIANGNETEELTLILEPKRVDYL